MDAYIERANLLLKQGRVNDAISQVKSALQLNPDNDEALAMYARCFFDKKEIDEGIKTTLRAIAINPDNHYYYYLLAFGFYRKNKNVEAIEHLHTSIRLNPFFCECYGLLSHIYCEEKQFKNALQKANEGLIIDSENISCLNGRAVALNKLKRTDEAIETMQQALAQDPDNDFTHSTVGWNYLEKGKNKVAGDHFREALRINPNNNNARHGLKEALKSKIPPYRWLLQYSFWLNNKGKKARWIIPVVLYLIVKLFSSVLENNSNTEAIGGTLMGIYLLFVVTTWLINPLANFFLLFHKDGKYAINTSEKWTAITVVSTLIMGIILCCIAFISIPGKVDSKWMIAAIAFWAMALPLGSVEYPLSFRSTSVKNKLSLLLISLGLFTILFSFINVDIAIIIGLIFIVMLVITSWINIFK